MTNTEFAASVKSEFAAMKMDALNERIAAKWLYPTAHQKCLISEARAMVRRGIAVDTAIAHLATPDPEA